MASERDMTPKICLINLFLFYIITTQNICVGLRSSMARYETFFNSEHQIVDGLDKYIRHETERLEIIKKSSGYEDEIPFVEQRIETLTSFYKQAKANASAVSDDARNLRIQHPTSTLVGFKNFVTNWTPFLHNETLYGFRFLEFLNVTMKDIPDQTDLANHLGNIIYIHLFYNLSASDIFDGNIMGQKGSPLTVMDAYDLALFAKGTDKPRLALQWFQVTLEQSKKIGNKTDINIPLLLTEIALLHGQFDDWDKAYPLVEEAFALNDTDDVVYKRFARVTTENVPRFRNFEDKPPVYWKNFTTLCQANDTFKPPLKWFHRCRYRCSPIPFKRYREEILSLSPYVSVFHNVISDDLIDDIKTKTAKNLTKATNYYYPKLEGTEILEHHTSARVLTKIAGDISGLNASYIPGEVSSGGALRVLNFGPCGLAKPHNHTSMYDERMFLSGNKVGFVTFYLTDVESGGATVFLDIGLRYQPKKGSALLWFVVQPNGDDDVRLNKAECPMAVGDKWIIEKDIHSHMNQAARPCALKLRGNQIGLDRAVHRFRHCRL
ncbi:prolyl 4-hydroxylase subunit alpha-2-like isoform X1 [Haliotis rubra]|uniref:prolyl 4-hydroxylase subunit alpha-2-like isoform X1 n=2 Tax=Haliotis rubra TaxID=36100 RepID=UPI001EE5A91E|nr:prolyl 4-hydroxylase subunit alpha-2-like isoform X1 [Haliotis rubra]